ncbi:hypothetical protein FISHEDRAFT_77245 [Fistulina hepatica ATCC 64428]|uniref:Uncharacterized protein n=1 Tax=Fistulina hepatica ATCC 64428 TaxID=1128425 RepID=A0A0D7A397_9AGAR|nr:hypothetical protein FISHEDRAFT_77245 [Fistulina hepatica ATCC 64428]
MSANIATAAAEQWMSVERFVGSSRSRPLLCARVHLLEAWMSCTIDPHRTSPPHEIFWSQIVGWDWTQDIHNFKSPLDIDVHDRDARSALWTAQAVWLEGAQINGMRAGEQERRQVVELPLPGFGENGHECAVLHAGMDAIYSELKSRINQSPWNCTAGDQYSQGRLRHGGCHRIAEVKRRFCFQRRVVFAFTAKQVVPQSPFTSAFHFFESALSGSVLSTASSPPDSFSLSPQRVMRDSSTPHNPSVNEIMARSADAYVQKLIGNRGRKRPAGCDIDLSSSPTPFSPRSVIPQRSRSGSARSGNANGQRNRSRGHLRPAASRACSTPPVQSSMLHKKHHVNPIAALDVGVETAIPFLYTGSHPSSHSRSRSVVADGPTWPSTG